MLGAIYAIIGFIFGLLFAAISLTFSSIAPRPASGQAMPGWITGMFGVGAVIFMPIVYGIMGFIGGLLTGALYNALAKRIGGIVIEVDQHGITG